MWLEYSSAVSSRDNAESQSGRCCVLGRPFALFQMPIRRSSVVDYRDTFFVARFGNLTQHLTPSLPAARQILTENIPVPKALAIGTGLLLLHLQAKASRFRRAIIMTREVFVGLALAAMSSTLCLGQKPAVAILPVQDNIQALPNMGQQITPLAVQGSRFEPLNPELAAYPGWLASNAVTTAVSADHKTLVVLTSGFNLIYSVENPPTPQPPWNPLISTEYAFIYDISQGTPVNKQIVPIANTYHGVVFDPNNFVFYVSGGPSDNIHIVVRSATGIWACQAAKLALGHSGGIGLNLKPNGATNASQPRSPPVCRPSARSK